MLRTALALLLFAGALHANDAISAGSPLALAVKKAVQDELKLTADQIATAKRLYEEAARDEKSSAAEALKKELKPEQLARLQEIRVQILGGAALADPEIARDLKLTAEQRKKITALWKNSEEDTRQILRVTRFKSDADRRKWVLVQRRDAGKELLKLLTGDQAAAFRRMRGAAIETKGLDN
ncbi:MAG: hypothetical protein U0797_28875 [Gemmataceae bacterium]